MTWASVANQPGDWNLPATVFFGIRRNATAPGSFAPSWLNRGLIATKTFGKWENGSIAFGPHGPFLPLFRLRPPEPIRVGGLVVYNFGSVDLLLMLKTDLAEQNYGGRTAWRSRPNTAI